jgi:hypothetical protein
MNPWMDHYLNPIPNPVLDGADLGAKLGETRSIAVGPLLSA